MKTTGKYKKKDFGTKYKIGVKIPRTWDVRGAMKLDREKGNNLWFEAQQKEKKILRDLGTFKIVSEMFDLSGYHYAPLIYAWDIKFYGRKKSRLVANGKVTIGPLVSEIWSGVVNIESVRMALFLAKQNDQKFLAADKSSAYSMADTE